MQTHLPLDGYRPAWAITSVTVVQRRILARSGTHLAATIGRAALLAQHHPRRPTAAAILGIARPRTCRVSLAWAGPVPRRVAALLTPPPPRHAVLLAAAVALTALAGVPALEAARDLHALLEIARAAH